MNPASEPILATSHLTMRFGGVVAVDNVDFSVAQGELRCLIGPNGAGKSTFFKCLTGQLRPSSGSILFDGEEIGGRHTHEIVARGIGIKTQVPNLFEGLPAYENISLAATRTNRADAAARIADEVLELMQIPEIAGDTVGTLAHGQRQLVELAMVLAGRPRLVLLDEPAAGMAGEERARLASVVRNLAGETTLIVVEHDMDFIKDIASTVTVFHRGRIFIEGHVEEIMAHSEVQEIYLGKETNAAA